MSERESLGVVARPVAVCRDCGMDLEATDEWHPLVFCLLFRWGIDDPEAHLRDLGYVRETVVNGSLGSLGPYGDARPIMWVDFNVPPDAEGARCAVVDSAWSGISPGVPVVMDDREGTKAHGVTLGWPWRGPSGTEYVRVVEAE